MNLSFYPSLKKYKKRIITPLFIVLIPIISEAMRDDVTSMAH